MSIRDFFSIGEEKINMYIMPGKIMNSIDRINHIFNCGFFMQWNKNCEHLPGKRYKSVANIMCTFSFLTKKVKKDQRYMNGKRYPMSAMFVWVPKYWKEVSFFLLNFTNLSLFPINLQVLLFLFVNLQMNYVYQKCIISLNRK